MIRKRDIIELLPALIGLAVVALTFSLLVPETFLTIPNARTVLAQYSGLAIATIGMTFVIVSGGIDLSVGSTAALASVTTAMVLATTASPTLALITGLATGAGVGLVNGLLVSVVRIPPFVATLGTLGAARGFAKWLANDQTVRVADGGWIGELSAKTPTPSWLLLPPSALVALLVAASAALLLRNTVFGVHVYAVGSSEPTARLCGVRVGRTKLFVYLLSGLCAGLAGLCLFARVSVGDPTGAPGMELAVVAAVVIGGASLSGGEGRIAGSALGALMLGFLANGCNLRGWSNSIQEIITGGIIALAVAIDAWRHRR
jgi:ribose transport system permease protein